MSLNAKSISDNITEAQINGFWQGGMLYIFEPGGFHPIEPMACYTPALSEVF